MYRFLFLLGAAVAAPPLWACSTCLCGDPTLTLIGTEKPFEGRQRVSLDFIVREESQGRPGIDEQIFEEARALLGYAWSPSERWTLTAQLPWVDKRVSSSSLAVAETAGVGDLELGAKLFLQAGNEIPVRDLYGLQFGLRVPTGPELETDGAAVDVDALPGAGAWVPNAGAWYGRYRFPWFVYVSAVYQYAVDEGYQGYRPGDVITGTAQAQYALTPEWALQAALDFRHAARNTFDAVADENSGGLFGALAPGLLWSAREDFIVNASVQIPLIEQYNGTQSTAPTFRLGLTYDFSSDEE